MAVPDEDQPKSAQQSKREGLTPNTERLQLHQTNSYSYVLLGPDGDRYRDGEYDGFYRGSEPVKHCLEGLLKVGGIIKALLQEHRARPMLLPEEEAAWRAAEVCHL